jgi:phosphohistidine phosphatase
MKTLTLVRHAKSSWDHPGLADRERPLNQRGLRDAPEMGRRLADSGQLPEQVLSSPAERALTTARLMSSEWKRGDIPVEVIEGVYGANVGGMLDILRDIDDELTDIMLVGHNPVQTMLVNALCGAMIDNMPTCAVAIINLDIMNWSEVRENCGILAHYDSPKNKP